MFSLSASRARPTYNDPRGWLFADVFQSSLRSQGGVHLEELDLSGVPPELLRILNVPLSETVHLALAQAQLLFHQCNAPYETSCEYFVGFLDLLQVSFQRGGFRFLCRGIAGGGLDDGEGKEYRGGSSSWMRQP